MLLDKLKLSELNIFFNLVLKSSNRAIITDLQPRESAE